LTGIGRKSLWQAKTLVQNFASGQVIYDTTKWFLPSQEDPDSMISTMIVELVPARELASSPAETKKIHVSNIVFS